MCGFCIYKDRQTSIAMKDSLILTSKGHKKVTTCHCMRQLVPKQKSLNQSNHGPIFLLHQLLAYKWIYNLEDFFLDIYCQKISQLQTFRSTFVNQQWIYIRIKSRNETSKQHGFKNNQKYKRAIQPVHLSDWEKMSCSFKKRAFRFTSRSTKSLCST